MQYISAPVHTFCLGMAASMGSLLLAGGEKGNRFALKNSTVMIHRESFIALACCHGSCIRPGHISIKPSGIRLTIRT